MDWVSRNYSRGAVFLFPIRRGLWSRRRFVLDSPGSALYPHVLWLPVPGRREGNPARPAQDHNRLYPYYPSPLHYFLALARGWIHLSGKRVLQLGALAVLIVFVPALSRGDNFLGQDEIVTFFEGGSSLRLFQDNVDLNLTERCPPLLISMTAKLIPYGLLDVCAMDYKGSKGVPATLDRILTDNDPSTAGTLNGTGANYLLELYLTGGIGAIILGSVFLGFSSRCFVQWISQRSLFAGIWAECLSRVLFAPRGTLGYVYERIPSLLLATLIVITLAWVASAQARSFLHDSSGSARTN